MRFALGGVDGWRVLAAHSPDAGRAQCCDLTLFATTDRPSPGQWKVLFRSGGEGAGQATAALRMDRPVEVWPPGGIAPVHLVRELGIRRQQVVAELSRPCSSPSVAHAEALSRTVYEALHSRHSQQAEAPGWRAAPLVAERAWPSDVYGLPVTIHQWRLRSTGRIRCELRAQTSRAEADVMIRILASRLRELGADPDRPVTWLEDWALVSDVPDGRFR